MSVFFVEVLRYHPFTPPNFVNEIFYKDTHKGDVIIYFIACNRLAYYCIDVIATKSLKGITTRFVMLGLIGATCFLEGALNSA